MYLFVLIAQMSSIICGQRVIQGVALDFGPGIHDNLSQDYLDDPEIEQDVYGEYKGFDPLDNVKEPILSHIKYNMVNLVHVLAQSESTTLIPQLTNPEGKTIFNEWTIHLHPNLNLT
ncbi:uncharacterized protein EDB93DRAFT_1108893 [Suillus bovinus]|uniref:uncharacterized protein n=1 Tax=Suillus bovinus TaxID=48563 RepID=UPI001B879089|nr:uncharacterized protein EDB93DRAFT_1108893 [Suillus bovinus]KAG2128904.1 hypothetical protein EDB93DRAFT_1108893 [Suillus bovinus]